MDFEGLNNINESKSDDLYFISENNMDGKTLQPRIPNNYFTQNGYEENQTKRVCFSTSIDKCLMALSMNCKGKEYYVHQPVGEYTIINPTIKDVPDSKITGEKWITSPVKIKCVSKIKVLDDDGKDGKKFNYGENTAELYGWKWEYINESITNENYFMSKDDKYLNLDKFESGESNICLVVGLDGSNKNQIARKIANDNDALYVNLNLIKNYCLDNVSDSMNIKDNKIFKDYFKTHSNYKAPHGKKYGRAIVVDDYIPKVEEDFVKFMFPYMKKHSKDKFVVVGSQLYRYMSESQIKRYPTIISGTSTIKSMYSHKNDPNRKNNDIYLHTFKDMNGNEYTRPLPGEIESDFMVNYRKDSLKFDKLKNQLESYSIDRLNDLPFFTSEDLESYSNYYTECDENKEWIDMYKLINIGAFSEDFYEINKNRIETLNELYKDYPNFDDYTKQRIVNLGWNPEVAFSSKNRRIATENTRLRIKKILNESNVVDEDVILESKSNKKPVYLVFTWTETLFGKGIRAVTKGTYTHACISLDKSLNKLYSYNLVNGISKLGGMAIEDLRTYNPNGSVLVFVTYVTEEQHKKLKKIINDLVNNVNKTKYSILNVFGILLNRPIETNHNMVCSQFVDKMMKTINLDLTNGKNSALVTPVDLYKSTSDKIYKVYEGGIKDFKPNKITKSEKNIKVNEAKLPIEFDSEGNLNINKIVDIQEEYNKSHKLLLNYDKSKNYKAMKEELFKLWALNIKLEKIIYKQKKANKSHYDLRARILNDFNKYIKIVSENEEDFNFSKEFDTSIYNNNSYSISKHTLKHGIQYIKSIFL